MRRATEPRELTTSDGHRVRRYPREGGGWYLVCHHPACCSTDGIDRTSEGLVVADVPVWILDAMNSHVAMHDEQSRSRP